MVQGFASLLLWRGGVCAEILSLYGLSSLHVGLVAGLFVGVNRSLGEVVGSSTR